MKIAVRRLVQAVRRNNPGMRDVDLAKLIGVPKAKVCDWQAGRRRVPPEALETMARLAGIPLADVLVSVHRETKRQRLTASVETRDGRV